MRSRSVMSQCRISVCEVYINAIERVEPSYWDQLKNQDQAGTLLPLSYLISVAEECMQL